MDVTPELIETIDFPEKFRGYDPEEVNKFLEQVGGKIVALNNALASATQRAEQAEQAAAAAAAAPPPPPAALTEEQEAAEATRTLMLAKRTGDAAIADAREAASALVDAAQAESNDTVESARAEGTRIVDAARQEAEQLVADARIRAESEFGNRHDELAMDIEALQQRRNGAAADVESLEARVEEYRAALTAVSTAITDMLANPELLHQRAPLDIDMTPMSPIVDTTGHEAGAPLEDASPHDGADTALAAEGVERSPFEPEGAPAEFHAEAPPVHDPATAGFPPPPDAPPPPGDSGAFDPPRSPFDQEPPSEASSGRLFAETPQAVGEPGSRPGAEPWAPGSWSAVVDEGGATTALSQPAPPMPGAPQEDAPAAVASTFSPTEQFESETPDPAHGAAEPVGGVPAFQVVGMEPEPPTGSFGGLSQDRYLRDLDAAVNSEEGDDADDAMSAFLLGDDEAQARRFGRRR